MMSSHLISRTHSPVLPDHGASIAPGYLPSSRRREEFTALLTPILSQAYRRAAHLAGQHADAEDLVQESAMLAYRYFERYRAGTNFKAWFFRILLNRFYTMRRLRAWSFARGPSPDEPGAELADVGNAGLGADHSVRLEHHEDRVVINAALDRLPLEFRDVCTLYLVQDLPYVDIARRLGVPVGTVRSRLHRGRQMLRGALLPLARDFGYGSALCNEMAAGGASWSPARELTPE